jgi:hypothetical protein
VEFNQMQDNTWIKLYRKEIDSAIWEKPPLYHRVWHWLLLNADYKTGQWTGTYQGIANGVRWTENKQEVTPTKRQIRVIIEFLNHVTSTSHTASHTTSHPKLSLTIVNWDTYQKPETEPRHTPRHTKSSNHVTTTSHPSNYIERAKEVKKLRNKEKGSTTARAHEPPSNDQILVDTFMQRSARQPYTNAQRGRGEIPAIQEDLNAFADLHGIDSAKTMIDKAIDEMIADGDPPHCISGALIFAKRNQKNKTKPTNTVDLEAERAARLERLQAAFDALPPIKGAAL